MGIGISLLLLAGGAILRWGVAVDDPSGFNIHSIAIILMVVGAIGVVVSAAMMSSARRRGTVVEP